MKKGLIAREEPKLPKNLSVASLEVITMWLLAFSQLYRQEIEPLAAMAYRETLRSYSVGQIERGCRDAVSRCTFMPKPAEIIESIQNTSDEFTSREEFRRAKLDRIAAKYRQ